MPNTCIYRFADEYSSLKDIRNQTIPILAYHTSRTLHTILEEKMAEIGMGWERKYTAKVRNMQGSSERERK